MTTRMLAMVGAAALSMAALALWSNATAQANPSSAKSASTRSEYRTFRDWRAVCDNGNRCVAFGPGTEDAGTGWVRVAMDAGRDATPHVMAGFWPGQRDGLSGTLTATIDGRRFTTELGTEDEAGGAFAADLGPVMALAMAQGRAMTLQNGDDAIQMSLSGAAAAMLWIDERQGRLKTATALIRKGDRPAAQVPAAPPLPVLVAGPVVSQDGFGDIGQRVPARMEALAAVKACRAETGGSVAEDQVLSARLDAQTELWGVPCFMGAYNIGHSWFITGPGGRNARPAILRSTRDKGGDAITVNGGYDPETRTLSAFSKGRGIGDCGIASTWVWTGRAFALQSESAMEDCWGMPSEFWPTTWRSR